MNRVTVWHNPRCSKSRAAIQILEEKNCEIEIIKYLDTKPDVNQIKIILKMLGITPRELMRQKEALYKEMNLKEESSDEALISAMANYPKLIERPIIVKDGHAIIARPTDKIVEFLG